MGLDLLSSISSSRGCFLDVFFPTVHTNFVSSILEFGKFGAVNIDALRQRLRPLPLLRRRRSGRERGREKRVLGTEKSDAGKTIDPAARVGLGPPSSLRSIRSKKMFWVPSVNANAAILRIICFPHPILRGAADTSWVTFSLNDEGISTHGRVWVPQERTGGEEELFCPPPREPLGNHTPPVPMAFTVRFNTRPKSSTHAPPLFW